MTEQFQNNTAKSRYEYQVDNATAFANYHIKDGILYIDYVEAPEQLRGTGAAGKLMQWVMEQARRDNIKVIPVCGYAAAWLRKHQEYEDMLA